MPEITSLQIAVSFACVIIFALGESLEYSFPLFHKIIRTSIVAFVVFVFLRHFHVI